MAMAQLSLKISIEIVCGLCLQSNELQSSREQGKRIICTVNQIYSKNTKVPVNSLHHYSSPAEIIILEISHCCQFNKLKKDEERSFVN